MHVYEIIINALYCGFNNISWTPFSMIFLFRRYICATKISLTESLSANSHMKFTNSKKENINETIVYEVFYVFLKFWLWKWVQITLGFMTSISLWNCQVKRCTEFDMEKKVNSLQNVETFSIIQTSYHVDTYQNQPYVWYLYPTETEIGATILLWNLHVNIQVWGVNIMGLCFPYFLVNVDTLSVIIKKENCDKLLPEVFLELKRL